MQRKSIALPFALLGVVLAGCGVREDSKQADRSIPADESGETRCTNIDEWEPNGGKVEFTKMFWDVIDGFGARSRDIPAYLCPGDEDWYWFQTEGFKFADPTLRTWALVEGASPENTITLEVYRADTLERLASDTQAGGVVSFEADEEYGHNLLIRVFSPTLDAEYPYRLTLLFGNGPN